MGEQVKEAPARITGFIDITKPHLKKVIHREGENEVKIKEMRHVRGFNTLAAAFQRAMEKADDGSEGVRHTSLRGRRTRR